MKKLVLGFCLACALLLTFGGNTFAADFTNRDLRGTWYGCSFYYTNSSYNPHGGWISGQSSYDGRGHTTGRVQDQYGNNYVLNGTYSVNPDGKFTMQLTSTQAGSSIPQTINVQGSLNLTADSFSGTGDGNGDPFITVSNKINVGFCTYADMRGTWAFYTFNSGIGGTDTTGWINGEITYDANGNVLSGFATDFQGNTSTITGGSCIIYPNGTFTMTMQLSQPGGSSSTVYSTGSMQRSKNQTVSVSKDAKGMSIGMAISVKK